MIILGGSKIQVNANTGQSTEEALARRVANRLNEWNSADGNQAWEIQSVFGEKWVKCARRARTHHN